MSLSANDAKADSSALTCDAKALRATTLRHVLLVKPSIIFLENPTVVMNTIRFIHNKQIKNCYGCSNPNGTCATTTEWEMTKHLTNSTVVGQTSVLESICSLRTYHNYSMPKVVSALNPSKEIGWIHQTSHRVGGTWFGNSNLFDRSVQCLLMPVLYLLSSFQSLQLYQKTTLGLQKRRHHFWRIPSRFQTSPVRPQGNIVNCSKHIKKTLLQQNAKSGKSCHNSTSS